MWLEPQTNGTYRTTSRWNVQDDECGGEGEVRAVPGIAWRTGPPPPNVVADPPLKPR
jgi:hypothetical protein